MDLTKIELFKTNKLIYLKGDNEFIKITDDEVHRIFYKNNEWYYSKGTCDEQHLHNYLIDETLAITKVEVFLESEDMYYNFKDRSDGTEK